MKIVRFLAPLAGALTATCASAQEAAKSVPTPTFKSAWRVELPSGVSRLAAADVAGDQKGRLLALSGSTLAVFNLIGDTPAKEAEIDLGRKAQKFVAGQFAAGKPAVIVAPGVVFYKDGGKYSRKDAAELIDVMGTARFLDGGECCFVLESGGDPTSYGVDLAGKKTIIGGHDMPPPTQGGGYHMATAHLPPELIEQIGLPVEARKLGVFGFFDAKKSGKILGWTPWVTNEGNYMATFEFHFGPVQDITPLWRSPKLDGKILDAQAAMDPKDGKRFGLLVLLASGADGKARQAEFLALE